MGRQKISYIVMSLAFAAHVNVNVAYADWVHVEKGFGLAHPRSRKKPKSVNAPFRRSETFGVVPTLKESANNILQALDRCNATYNLPGTNIFQDFVARAKKEGKQVYPFHATYEKQSGLVVVDRSGHVTIVFKGTNSLDNWKTNFHGNWAIDQKSGGRIHNGMLRHWRALKKPVFDILEKIAQEKGKEIYQLNVDVEGHSLGGGTALIAAYALKDLLAIEKVTTFGAPQVFDLDTAALYNKFLGAVTENIQQVLDPVPYAQGISPVRAAVGIVKPAAAPFLTVMPTARSVGNVIILPQKSSDIHVLSGYKEDIEAVIDTQTDGASNKLPHLAPQKDTGVKGFVKRAVRTVGSVFSTAEHYAHKAFKSVKDRAVKMWKRFF